VTPLAANKYQFVTRSQSGPKHWVFNTRSALVNLGFFNRHKPQADGTNLDVRSEAWKAAKRSSDHLASGLLPRVLGGPSNNEIIGVMGQVRHGIRIGRCPTSRRPMRIEEISAVTRNVASMRTSVRFYGAGPQSCESYKSRPSGYKPNDLLSDWPGAPHGFLLGEEDVIGVSLTPTAHPAFAFLLSKRGTTFQNSGVSRHSPDETCGCRIRCMLRTQHS
jgi:hypothetical protein